MFMYTSMDRIKHVHFYIFDSTIESFLSVDEWIAQEISRVMNNEFPRHCSNYETLIEAIENVSQIERLSNTFIFHFTDEPAMTKTNYYQFSQYNLLLSFYKLLRYCQKEKLQLRLAHHRVLIEILMELEKLAGCLGKVDEMEQMVRNLACILFGERVPISNDLLEPWLMLSTWIQQGREIMNSNVVAAGNWLKLGVLAFQIAKRMCHIY